MLFASLAVIVGLALLVWSADRFIEGAAAVASHLGMSPLLIGMVIIGFGTSAPEIVVSVFAAIQGNPGIALGNAYGSNIANISLVLGLTAVISPIAVQSSVLRKEMPVLLAVTALTAWQIWDAALSRPDGLVLLAVFAVIMGWTIRQGMIGGSDVLSGEIETELEQHQMPLKRAVIWLLVGMIVLIASSRLLVWGAVVIAQSFGVSDLIIGLTIVAIGTSLPELAAAIIATRKGEHDLALGNVLGSNLFNTLAVVGIAGTIHPMVVGPEVFYRDIAVMSALTVALFVFGFGIRRQGRINRFEGSLFLLSYIAYTGWLINNILVAQ